jgi:hypothetical protein
MRGGRKGLKPRTPNGDGFPNETAVLLHPPIIEEE